MAADGIFFSRVQSKARLDAETVILVEGVDDGYFLDTVLTSIGSNPDKVGVCLADGKDKLPILLKAVLKSPWFTSGKIKRYAVVRDVDESVLTCMEECRKLFSDAGEPFPEANSFSLRSDGRSNGLFLMPSAASIGSLETLALQTLGQSPLLGATDAYLASSVAHGGSADHLDKRRMQAFLASSANPLCNGVGWATRNGHFNINAPELNTLKDFLMRLQSR